MPAPKLDYARKQSRPAPIGQIVAASLLLTLLLCWIAGVIYLSIYGS
jgi:hypothetical protein